MHHTIPPTVLCLSGNDPTGGAGLQADIESLAAQGCHAAPVVTAITVQDTHNVHSFSPTPPELLLAQAEAVLNDMAVAAIKIGMIGSGENIDAIKTLLLRHPELPVVLDPILAAGGGTPLASQAMGAALRTLLPLTTVVTPNTHEAAALIGESGTGESGADDSATHPLLQYGCPWVLITGTHDTTDDVIHQLHSATQATHSYSGPRLPHSYHGSGCTLAAAIAGQLARGEAVPDAVDKALTYTLGTLQTAYRPGGGQHLPNRLHETRND